MVVIKKWVAATFILTFLVVLAGGIVRTTQSGMGCPDWPRCFGQWIPPIEESQLPADYEKYLGAQDIDHTFNVYHTWIEYINRLLAVALGVFAVIQFWLLYKRRTMHAEAYRLAVAFLTVVILTGLLGALVVKLNLAHASISLHLFFALLLTQIQLGLYMTVIGRYNKKTAGVKIKRTLFLLLVIMIIQVVLGTMVRIYVDDVSMKLQYAQREAWLANPPIVFYIHRVFSVIVFISVFYASFYCRKVEALQLPFQRLIIIIILSMLSGIGLYYLDMPAIAQPIHLLLATFAITQTMYLLLYTNTKELLHR